jgi:hypothetical protein
MMITARPLITRLRVAATRHRAWLPALALAVLLTGFAQTSHFHKPPDAGTTVNDYCSFCLLHVRQAGAPTQLGAPQRIAVFRAQIECHDAPSYAQSSFVSYEARGPPST